MTIALAEAYYLRYPDIASDTFFGRSGPMGIYGAREHYRQYGRSEGRIFGDILKPEDMSAERTFAEAYWERYQDVAKSRVWGRDGNLGILGPRDHFRYIGQRQGKIWGMKETDGN